MTRHSVSPRGSDRSMVGLNRPFADQFRTTSFMHCSSSTAGIIGSYNPSWAGCPDHIVVSGLSPDGEVFLLTSPFIDRYPVQVDFLASDVLSIYAFAVTRQLRAGPRRLVNFPWRL